MCGNKIPYVAYHYLFFFMGIQWGKNIGNLFYSIILGQKLVIAFLRFLMKEQIYEFMSHKFAI